MIDKSIYVVAKIFDQQGCIAYRCKTLNEARCLPGTLIQVPHSDLSRFLHH